MVFWAYGFCRTVCQTNSRANWPITFGRRAEIPRFTPELLDLLDRYTQTSEIFLDWAIRCANCRNWLFERKSFARGHNRRESQLEKTPPNLLWLGGPTTSPGGTAPLTTQTRFSNALGSPPNVVSARHWDAEYLGNSGGPAILGLTQGSCGRFDSGRLEEGRENGRNGLHSPHCSPSRTMAAANPRNGSKNQRCWYRRRPCLPPWHASPNDKWGTLPDAPVALRTLGWPLAGVEPRPRIVTIGKKEAGEHTPAPYHGNETPRLH